MSDAPVTWQAAKLKSKRPASTVLFHINPISPTNPGVGATQLRNQVEQEPPLSQREKRKRSSASKSPEERPKPDQPSGTALPASPDIPVNKTNKNQNQNLCNELGTETTAAPAVISVSSSIRPEQTATVAVNPSLGATPKTKYPGRNLSHEFDNEVTATPAVTSGIGPQLEFFEKASSPNTQAASRQSPRPTPPTILTPQTAQPLPRTTPTIPILPTLTPILTLTTPAVTNPVTIPVTPNPSPTSPPPNFMPNNDPPPPTMQAKKGDARPPRNKDILKDLGGCSFYYTFNNALTVQKETVAEPDPVECDEERAIIEIQLLLARPTVFEDAMTHFRDAFHEYLELDLANGNNVAIIDLYRDIRQTFKSSVTNSLQNPKLIERAQTKYNLNGTNIGAAIEYLSDQFIDELKGVEAKEAKLGKYLIDKSTNTNWDLYTKRLFLTQEIYTIFKTLSKVKLTTEHKKEEFPEMAIQELTRLVNSQVKIISDHTATIQHMQKQLDTQKSAICDVGTKQLMDEFDKTDSELKLTDLHFIDNWRASDDRAKKTNYVSNLVSQHLSRQACFNVNYINPKMGKEFCMVTFAVKSDKFKVEHGIADYRRNKGGKFVRTTRPSPQKYHGDKRLDYIDIKKEILGHFKDKLHKMTQPIQDVPTDSQLLDAIHVYERIRKRPTVMYYEFMDPSDGLTYITFSRGTDPFRGHDFSHQVPNPYARSLIGGNYQTRTLVENMARVKSFKEATRNAGN